MVERGNCVDRLHERRAIEAEKEGVRPCKGVIRQREIGGCDDHGTERSQEGEKEEQRQRLDHVSEQREADPPRGPGDREQEGESWTAIAHQRRADCEAAEQGLRQYQ